MRGGIVDSGFDMQGLLLCFCKEVGWILFRNKLGLCALQRQPRMLPQRMKVNLRKPLLRQPHVVR